MTGPLPEPSIDDGHAPATAGRSRAYAVARRHSARVRWLKVAIPIGAGGAALLIALATLFDPFGRLPGLTLGPVSLTGTKIAMENPKLTGFRKDARPYEVTAKAAFQDVRKPGLIELKDMTAKLKLDAAGTAAELVSTLGLFDTAKEHLDLGGDIRITTTRGEEVMLKSAAVDFKGGTVRSSEAVRITTRQGTIEAEGLDVSDGGSTIAFKGRVRTQFLRVLPEPATTASAPPRPAPRVSQAEPAR